MDGNASSHVDAAEDERFNCIVTETLIGDSKAGNIAIAFRDAHTVRF